jgi:mRNA interferase RelE/StbE
LGSEPKRYAVFFKPSAAATLAELPRKDQKLIGKRIDALAANPRPRGVEKLQGADELYRVRSGDYRIIYQIEDAVLKVLVMKIGQRGDVYRGLGR